MVVALADAAAAAGYEVEVLTSDPIFVDELAKRGIGSIREDLIVRSIRPARDVWDSLQLRRILRRQRYDIVHTHTSKAGIIGRAAARSTRTPTVVHTVHGFSYREETPATLKRAANLVERVASSWCDAVVPVANYLSDAYARFSIAPPSKIVTIPNGVPDSSLVTGSRERVGTEFSISPDRPLWVCQGRLAAFKGLEVLLKTLAVSRVRSLRPLLLIAGGGPLRDDLSRLARELGVDDMATFTGYRSDIDDLVSAADLVVLPSFREGLSVAVLEAMSAGAAIITTTIPANREATGDNAARLVPPGDAEALADALVELTASPTTRESLATAARRRYVANYRESMMTNAYLELYESLRGPR